MRHLTLTAEFNEFLLSVQNEKGGDKYLEKIGYVLQIVAQEKIPSKTFLELLKGGDWKGLFEIKASVGSHKFRILCLFPDENYGDELVLLNGFKKKDDKTIKKHKSLALKLRKKFLDDRKAKEESEAPNLDNKTDAELNDSKNKD
jgi:hypothetical protein